MEKAVINRRAGKATHRNKFILNILIQTVYAV